jgi:Fe-S-cluster containining protein
VWVDQDEIEQMAAVMEMSTEAFEAQFIRTVRRRKSLKEYPDGDCILLDPERRTCLAYQGRPTQCRTWPFWSSNLANRKSWKETCEVCPGAGTGKLYTFDQIEIERKKKKV